jgi:hypothetical protein
MKDTAERQLRAYVGVSPLSIDIQGPSARVAVRYEVKNTGQTPAHNVRHAASLEIWPFPLPKDFIVASPTDYIGGMSVGNSGTVSGEGFRSMGGPISFQTISQIHSSGQRIYLAVIVKYFDIFGIVERTTRLCVAVANLEQVMRGGGASGQTVTGRSDGGVEFQYPDQYNDSD